MIPQPGTYPAKPNGQIVVYESERKGSLCVALPVALCDSDPKWSGVFYCALILGDGTVQERTVQNLKTIFGWDGIDPFWLMDQDFGETVFDAVCEHEPYTPEGGETRMTFKVKYINALGSSAKLPEAGDRKSLLAKYGSKFRAVAAASGKPVTKPATPKPDEKKAQAELPTPKTQPKPPSGPPGKKTTTAGGQPPTATMEEAWAALVTAKKDENEDALGTMFYGAIEEHFPGKNNSDLTIQNWGALKAEFEKLAS